LVDRPHMRRPDPDGFVCLLGCKGRVADGGGEAVKANNHPLVKDLRRILDKHGLKGAVLVSITDAGRIQVASAGKTVKLCNALGPALKDDAIAELAVEMDMRMMATEDA